MADIKKKTIVDFRNMKAAGEKITWLTGYDYLTAKYEERAGVEMILPNAYEAAFHIFHGEQIAQFLVDSRQMLKLPDKAQVVLDLFGSTVSFGQTALRLS